MELTLIQFIHLISLLPNPLKSYSEGKEICSVIFSVTQGNVSMLRVNPNINDPYSKEKVFYDNSEQVQFKLNIHDGQIPFWEPINQITIKKYNKNKEESLKNEGLFKIPYKPI